MAKTNDNFRLYLKFGNQATWKKYLKNTVISANGKDEESLWTMYGDYMGIACYMENPPVMSQERLDCSISFSIVEERARKMIEELIDKFQDNVIILADLQTDSGEKLNFYYFCDELREVRQSGKVKYAKMHKLFEDDEEQKSYIDRWLMMAGGIKLNDKEKEFYRKIEAQELPEFVFGKTMEENRLTIKFSNTRHDMTAKFLSEMDYNDDLFYLSLYARLEAAVVDRNTIDFSDACLVPVLARRLSMMVSDLVMFRKVCSAEVEYTGVKKADQKKSFRMTMDKYDEVMTVKVNSLNRLGNPVEKKYSYRYDEDNWEERYKDIVGIEFADDFSMNEKIEKALALIK